LISFGMKVCGHREDAEDMAQEVLVKSLPHLKNLTDPRALSTWLSALAEWPQATQRKTS
jgi:RNA polymerase sigma-70 factor (ECF subfamily)